jgi:hypothetical protein
VAKPSSFGWEGRTQGKSQGEGSTGPGSAGRNISLLPVSSVMIAASRERGDSLPSQCASNRPPGLPPSVH